MRFKDNFLLYTLLPLLCLTLGASYVRFMVINDYYVAYEAACDPEQHSCFVGCENDECTEQYYYANIIKYAVDLEAQCGIDITDCDSANNCQEKNDRDCSITYCDPEIESCSTPSLDLSEPFDNINELSPTPGNQTDLMNTSL